MKDNKDKKTIDKKEAPKNNKKLTIIIACAVVAAAVVALVLGLTLGKSKTPGDQPGGDTGAVVTGGADTTDPNGADSTAAPDGTGDDADSSADPADTSEPAATDENGGESTSGGADTAKPDDTKKDGDDTTAEPEGTTVAPETAEPDDTDKIDDDPIDAVTLPEAEVFVTEGPAGDDSSWPADKIPADIPGFKNIVKFYNCTYQVDEDIEGWFMSWDAKQADFDKWMEEVSAAGFYPSISVAYYYGNGNIIMDIETEDYGNGTVWVSVDIFRSKTTWLPDELSGVYPSIDTTATVWYTLDDDEYFEIHYQCAKDWEGDLNGYFEKLYDAGFDLSYGKGTKTVDGKTYTVTWGTEDKDREVIRFYYGA